MTTLNLKKNIHKAIDKIEDAGLLQAVYVILEKQLGQAEYELTEAQKKELDIRIANLKSGSSSTHSWADVKKTLAKRGK
jgi:putative addiction module component (TIGR02574 family)